PICQAEASRERASQGTNTGCQPKSFFVLALGFPRALAVAYSAGTTFCAVLSCARSTQETRRAEEASLKEKARRKCGRLLRAGCYCASLLLVPPLPGGAGTHSSTDHLQRAAALISRDDLDGAEREARLA